MKRILKFLAYIILTVISIFALVILYFYIGYQRTVGVKQGQMQVAAKPGEFGKWVNPFIGTGGFPTYTSADDIPGVTVPFGMVRLSPDTQFFLDPMWSEGGSISTAGYYYGDHKIMGFSHTRLVGTGAYEGGLFRVIPSIGEQSQKDYRNGHYTEFSHKNEVAFPGYYAVKLPEQGILAELTASARVGIHRYTFFKDEVPHILIDVSNGLGHARSADGEVNIYPEKHEVTGTIKTFDSFSGRYGGLKAYFRGSFIQPLGWEEHTSELKSIPETS